MTFRSLHANSVIRHGFSRQNVQELAKFYSCEQVVIYFKSGKEFSDSTAFCNQVLVLCSINVVLCSVYVNLCSIYVVLYSIYVVLCFINVALCSVYVVLCSIYVVLCCINVALCSVYVLLSHLQMICSCIDKLSTIDLPKISFTDEKQTFWINSIVDFPKRDC